MLNLIDSLAESALKQNPENPTMEPELLDDLLQKCTLVAFIQDKVRVWVKINNKFFNGKNGKILEFLSKNCMRQKEYAMAQGFSVHCENLEVSKELLLGWMGKAQSEEQDLYVIRYLLLKLVARRPKEAETLYTFFKEEGYLDTALANMIKYIFQSLKLNSGEVFSQLSVTYEKSLQRDPELGMLMEKIGEMYFNIRKPQATNFLANMMSQFLSPPSS